MIVRNKLLRNKLLKHEIYYIFCAIYDVYGNELLNKFVSYVKKMYGLDSSYNWVDIIEVMEEDELIMNISIFFDSEDERHISEIGIKDHGLDKLIMHLKNHGLDKLITYLKMQIHKKNANIYN